MSWLQSRESREPINEGRTLSQNSKVKFVKLSAEMPVRPG
jgi:hypothetical protein